jgi:hypothetical protein
MVRLLLVALALPGCLAPAAGYHVPEVVGPGRVEVGAGGGIAGPTEDLAVELDTWVDVGVHEKLDLRARFTTLVQHQYGASADDLQLGPGLELKLAPWRRGMAFLIGVSTMLSVDRHSGAEARPTEVDLYAVTTMLGAVLASDRLGRVRFTFSPRLAYGVPVNIAQLVLAAGLEIAVTGAVRVRPEAGGLCFVQVTPPESSGGYDGGCMVGVGVGLALRN